jgi:hypothetical protein
LYDTVAAHLAECSECVEWGWGRCQVSKAISGQFPRDWSVGFSGQHGLSEEMVKFLVHFYLYKWQVRAEDSSVENTIKQCGLRYQLYKSRNRSWARNWRNLPVRIRSNGEDRALADAYLIIKAMNDELADLSKEQLY